MLHATVSKPPSLMHSSLHCQELSCACPNVRQLAVTFSGRTFPQLSRALTGLLRGMPHITTLLLTWQDLTQVGLKRREHVQ